MNELKNMNKRKNQRLNCLVPVDSKRGSIFDEACTVDFSKGGMGFLSRHNIPINKKIAIELDLESEGEPVLVIGQVKWVRPIENSDQYRIGVYFDSIVQGSKARLNSYFVKK